MTGLTPTSGCAYSLRDKQLLGLRILAKVKGLAWRHGDTRTHEHFPASNLDWGFTSNAFKKKKKARQC